MKLSGFLVLSEHKTASQVCQKPKQTAVGFTFWGIDQPQQFFFLGRPGTMERDEVSTKRHRSDRDYEDSKRHDDHKERKKHKKEGKKKRDKSEKKKREKKHKKKKSGNDVSSPSSPEVASVPPALATTIKTFNIEADVCVESKREVSSRIKFLRLWFFNIGRMSLE